MGEKNVNVALRKVKRKAADRAEHHNKQRSGERGEDGSDVKMVSERGTLGEHDLPQN